MRNAKIFIAFIVILLAPACGPVEWLNPCFKEEDLVLNPTLAGTWKAEEGRSILKFRQSGGKGYEMLDIEVQADDTEPEQTKYEAHLVRLGEYLFLDLVPEAPQVKPGAYTLPLPASADGAVFQPHLVEVGDGLYASLVHGLEVLEAGQAGDCCEVHLIQAHWVFRVRLDGSSLRLADLSEDWFKAAVDQGRVHLGFERVNDSLVLTASTEELQAFLLEFAGDELAFPENDMPEYRRQE
jgi:hypothetical protein